MIEPVVPQDLGLDGSELSICRRKWVSGDGMTEIGCRLGVVTDMCQAGGHILVQEVRKPSANSIALASQWAIQATALEVTPNCEPQAHMEVAGGDTAAGRHLTPFSVRASRVWMLRADMAWMDWHTAPNISG